MINLLPHERKQSYRFARRNSIVVRAIIGFVIGLAALSLVVGAGLWYINQTTNDYRASITDVKTTLEKQQEAKTVARVQDISNSLKLVVNVLEQEVLFSKLLKQIGVAMPNGTILRNLSISGDLSGALDLEAGAVDYNAASQLQLNLADPDNRIFKSADIVAITCDGTDPTYPCTVTLRAAFTTNSTFMLLSEDRGGAN